MSTHPNPTAITELQRITQNLHATEPDDLAVSPIRYKRPNSVWLMYGQVTEKVALIARHNELVDVLWSQHKIANRIDPAKYLPVEIVNLIFSFVVYHVVELEPEDPFSQPGSTSPLNELISGLRDAPLLLASVSRDWCRIAVNYPPLWSTVITDRLEDEGLERIHLFLDRSGKELLDIILFADIKLTTHLKDLLLTHADRFKTLVGPARPTMSRSRLEPIEGSTGLVNWSGYTIQGRRISSVPIPRCLRHVQMDRWSFDLESLIQFTFFNNLESLFISIQLGPKDIQWDKKLRFGRLRDLQLRISCPQWNGVPISTSPLIEWFECPALVGLRLFYNLNQQPFEQMYPPLEACLLRFRSLQKLQVYLTVQRSTIQSPDAGRLQNMRPATFEGSLESVHFRFDSESESDSAWAAAFTERFFSVFVPKTNLGWQYAHFPSPATTANLIIMHINGSIKRVQSTLVAPEMAKLEFPFLEELYLREGEPKWLNLLYVPRLIYLYIEGFIPSDLRHISNSIVSSVYLKFQNDHPGPWEIFLPSFSKLEVDLQINDIFHLNVHPSQIHAVTINVHWDEKVACPPYWTNDYISRMLGTVTHLNLECNSSQSVFEDPSDTLIPFVKPFVCLAHLKLFRSLLSEPSYIDQLAQHLVDPSFLPNLQALSINEHPSWPDFFQYIQQRQSSFLTGHIHTSLKSIIMRMPVHGALLEHLKESLAGKYIGLMNMPPRRKGSKDWPLQLLRLWLGSVSGN